MNKMKMKIATDNKLSFVIEKAGELKKFMETAGTVISDGSGNHYYFLPYWVQFTKEPGGDGALDAHFYSLGNLPPAITELIKHIRDGK